MNTNEIYNIEWNKLGRWLLPVKLRRVENMPWVVAMFAPLVWLHQRLVAFRKAKAYELGITGQVCRLEALLNDRYDFTERRIYIADAIEQEATFIYQEPEAHEIIVYQELEDEDAPIWYQESENVVSVLDDFVVMVPLTVSFNFLEMRKLIMNYRMPGMRFTIQTF